MKKFVRWTIGILLVLIVLGVLAVFSLNTIVRLVAEKRIRVVTGMETQIGKLDISLRSQRVRIENLKLINPPEFGGSLFLHLRELDVQYDLEAFRSNNLVLKTLRIDLAEVHIVQNKAGKRNTDIFDQRRNGRQKNAGGKPPEEPPPPRADLPNGLEFGGVQILDVSIDHAKFTSEKNPGQNFDKHLGVKNKVYRDIRNEKDLQAVATVLLMQVGFTGLLQELLNPPRGHSGGSSGEAARPGQNR
jgi:hypothetical protein